ncbi:MAG TPA: elongation factor G, partial [Rhizomicrobium sp.]|nr:elongation factor G [Rhizomicrobium sp.]
MSQDIHKDHHDRIKAAPRAIALMGPHGGGKTSLLESIAAITGAVPRKGSVPGGSSLGDSAPESRARQMSVEMNVLTTQYLDEEFTFLDCPGSIEFLSDTLNLLPGIDAAIVVCEPDAAKVMMLQPFLKRLADAGVPHLLFINKFDKARVPLRALLTLLQEASEKPLLLRQIPIWEHGVATGFVDLALERAFAYRPHGVSEVTDIADYAREKEARFQMLEKLADYDEHLMEELLGDVEPPRDEVFGGLKRELAEGLVVPVMIGSAEGDNGVRRLLKSLRHDVPEVAAVASRAKLAPGGDAVVQVIKTLHGGHGGKFSLARVLRGQIKDGAVLHGAGGREARIGGIFALVGDKPVKRASAQAGDTVALARLEPFATGETLSTAKSGGGRLAVEQLTPVYRLAVAAPDRKDEVKLSSAIAKLCEEDPSLLFEHNAETHDLILAGQGEIHLKVAVEKLQSRYGLKLT